MVVNNCFFKNYKLNFVGKTYTHTNKIKIYLGKRDQNRRKRDHLVIENTKLIGTKGSEMQIFIVNSYAQFINVSISQADQPVPVVMTTDQSILLLDSCELSDNIVHSNQSKFAVLSVTNSSLEIENCVSRNNEGREGGVIRVSTYSTLGIANSVFDSNIAKYGGAVYASFNVELHINNCSFQKNKAFASGGALFSSNAKYNIAHSYFCSNNVLFGTGGAIVTYDNSEIKIGESIFKNNSAEWKGGALASSDNNNLQIETTNFIENFGELKDGVIRMQVAGYASFRNCSFIRNSAGYSRGVGTAKGNVTMFFDNCLFENNTADFTGIILIEDGAYVSVQNSKFYQNSGVKRCLLHTDTEAKLFVKSSYFFKNTGSRIVYAVSNSRVHFDRCYFLYHAMNGGSLMIFTYSYLNVSQCVFSHNTIPTDGGVIVGRYASTVHVESSVFNHSSTAMIGGVFYMTIDCFLYLKNSMFFNNTGGGAGVVYSQDSTLKISNCSFVNCSSSGNGGVVTAVNYTTIFATNSSFLFNKAVYGGCFSAESNSSIAIYNSLFEGNSAREGAVLIKKFAGNVSMENCTLVRNKGDQDEGICAHNIDKLRLSNGLCEQSKKECIVFDCQLISPKQCKMYTYNYIIKFNDKSINSRTDSDFLNKALEYKMIKENSGTMDVIWIETPFASRKS